VELRVLYHHRVAEGGRGLVGEHGKLAHVRAGEGNGLNLPPPGSHGLGEEDGGQLAIPPHPVNFFMLEHKESP